MTTPHPLLDRLAQRVKQRRLQLHPSREAAARSVGLSKDTWLRVERGERVRDTSYARIDEALQWAVGSCAAILCGGESTEIERSRVDDTVVFSPVRSDDLEEDVQQAVADAAIAVTDLPASQIRRLKAQVIDELRRRGAIPPRDEN